MGYVVYVSNYAIQERKRTPLGKIAAWLTNRVAGTFLQPMLSFLFKKSVVAQIATAILLGLLIGAIIDLSVSSKVLPVPHNNLIVCAILGAIVGLAAQGGGGGFIGLFWGWLIGGIADTIAVEFLSDKSIFQVNKIVAWFVTVLVGWAFGVFVSWCFEKTEKHKKLRKILINLTILITLASILFFLHSLVQWLIHNPSLLGSFFKWIGRHWKIIVLIPSWLIVLGFPLLMFLNWKYADTVPYYGNPFDRYDEQGPFGIPRVRYYDRSFLEYIKDWDSKGQLWGWLILCIITLVITKLA